MQPFRYVSAFSGIGGGDLGADRAGAECVAQVEIDPHCQTVLGRNWPTVPKFGDITDVRASDLADADAVLGTFPCQDTSTAAPNRAGVLGGSRSGHFFDFAGLLHEYLRLVDESSARWVVIENPVGLLSSPGVDKATGVDRTGWDMAAVARGLEDLGYGWAYRVVDSHDLGDVQHRTRVFVVGHRGGDSRPAGAVLGLCGPSGEAAGARPVGPQRRPQVVGSADGSGDEPLIWRKSARARKKLTEGGYETWRLSEHANTLTGFDGTSVNRQTHLIVQDGRVRVLTLAEMERLSGVPAGWTDGLPTSARARLLGNILHPSQSEWLFRSMIDVHRAVPMLRAA